MTLTSALAPVSVRNNLLHRWFSIRFGAALGCAALADYLFYDHDLGVSAAIFLSVLALLSVCLNRTQASSATTWRAFPPLFTGLVALVDDVNALSLALGVLSLAYFAQNRMAPRQSSLLQRSKSMIYVFKNCVVQFFIDRLKLNKYNKRVRKQNAKYKFLLNWVMPLGLGAVFLALFSAANPIIENIISMLVSSKIFTPKNLPHLVFWASTIVLVWPFLHVRREARAPAPNFHMRLSDRYGLLTPPAILRALILCNLVFAAQTFTDAVYLWGGISLPQGVTYAAYAHRGAYALGLAVMIAAGFALVALREGGAAEASRGIKILILVWLAQNFILVLSAMLRLDLYVGAYSLTYWRTFAFIWMGWTAICLALIAMRILWGKTNLWLAQANFRIVALTLYLCCFVDFPPMIAHYNIAHSTIGDGDHNIDADYLMSLGPKALPALDQYIGSKIFAYRAASQDRVKTTRLDWAEETRAKYLNWRAWTVQTWRLNQYLDDHPNAPNN